MDVIDIVLGVVGICFGSWKYVKGTGNRSKPLGMIIFIFGFIFLVRGILIRINITGGGINIETAKEDDGFY